MQDQPARVVEVVVVGDRLADVPVLLRGSRGVELLDLELEVDDRLQEVERSEDVRRDGLVRPVPRLADVRLGAEVEDVRPIRRRLLELADEAVDRDLVREVGEVHLDPAPELPDVVERAARRRADERVHRGAELDERLGQVRAHEAVRAGDDDGAAAVDVSELVAEVVERGACPEGVVRHGPYASALVGKGTDTSGPGSLRAGALTALSLLVVSGVAAATGVLIAHEFGRSEQTDGLLAAYGLVIVIVVAAQAIRVAVLPPLARAAQDGRLAGELAGYALALLVIAIPLVLAAEIWAGWLGKHLIGHQSPLGQETAAEALKWMVPAGALQLFAGLAASGLAALDDYGTAAIGYGVGSAAGLALILWRAEPNGIVSVAWGTALNAAIAVAVPACWLTIRALRSGMPRSAVVPRDRGLRARFGAFGVGVVLPIAQQLLYVVTLPFAARVGPGAATTFVYAYLAAAALVTVTAGSLGLVTTVPLSRLDGTVTRTVRHVVSASWLAFVLVGAAAGAFAVAGGEVVQSVLGSSYRGNVGAEVGRVFVCAEPLDDRVGRSRGHVPADVRGGPDVATARGSRSGRSSFRSRSPRSACGSSTSTGWRWRSAARRSRSLSRSSPTSERLPRRPRGSELPPSRSPEPASLRSPRPRSCSARRRGRRGARALRRRRSRSCARAARPELATHPRTLR